LKYDSQGNPIIEDVNSVKYSYQQIAQSFIDKGVLIDTLQLESNCPQRSFIYESNFPSWVKSGKTYTLGIEFHAYDPKKKSVKLIGSADRNIQIK
jgi:hypothetical protein